MEEHAGLDTSQGGGGRTGSAGLVPVRQSFYFSYPPNACLTEITRYWGHEHDYRNNLISVRWGGVVPRRLPCDRKESESLRDGPFSGFRPSSNATPGNSAAENSPIKGEQIKEDALSEADANGSEGQTSGENSGDKQTPETMGNSPDGPPLTGADRDEEANREEFDIWSEPEEDPAPLVEEDEFDVAPQVGDEAQPFRWQSDVLCVADPFIETKVKFGSEGIDGWTVLCDIPDHRTWLDPSNRTLSYAFGKIVSVW